MKNLFVSTLFLTSAFGSWSKASTIHCQTTDKRGLPIVKIEIFDGKVIAKEIFESTLTRSVNEGKALPKILSDESNVFRFDLGNNNTVDNYLIVTFSSNGVNVSFESLDRDDWSGQKTELNCD